MAAPAASMRSTHCSCIIDALVASPHTGDSAPASHQPGAAPCAQAFLGELAKARGAMIEALMWEIAKNAKDAAAEFDRTVAFVQAAAAGLYRDCLQNASPIGRGRVALHVAV